MNHAKHFLANLPDRPGVYHMLDLKGQVIYVGKAKNLKNRVSSYFSNQNKDNKTESLVKQIANIDFTVTHTENEAILLECNLIKQYRPKYNILLRDDKSYPYIVLTTQHAYPRIDLYRGARKKEGISFGPFPSSLAARETISLLQKLFRLRTCSESYFAARSRPCLLYQIKRCAGPCVKLITQEEYRARVSQAILFLQGKSDELIHALQAKMQLHSDQLDYELAASVRDQIARLRQVQEKQYINVKQGEIDVIGLVLQAGVVCIQLMSIRGGQLLGSRAYFPSVPASESPEAILSAFITQHYFDHALSTMSMPKDIVCETKPLECEWLERALTEESGRATAITTPSRGEKKKWLDMAMTSARQSLQAKMIAKANMMERFIALKEALALPALPTRMECFDVSHVMGEATVAACVVFDVEGAKRGDYRRFNITDTTPGDDVAAMQQAVFRRYKRLQKDMSLMPQLVLIDGGKTQLRAAQKAFANLFLTDITLIGVSKGAKRKAGFETLHFLDKSPKHLPADSLALHLIQQIRDEAHRFAVLGHRMRRDKKRKESALDDIPGVGAKRRRELLRFFGGIQGLTRASLEDILKVTGINQSLAERIFATFHDSDN